MGAGGGRARTDSGETGEAPGARGRGGGAERGRATTASGETGEAPEARGSVSDRATELHCVGGGGRKRKGNFGNSKGISNGGNGAGEAAVAKVKILAIPRSPGVGNEE